MASSVSLEPSGPNGAKPWGVHPVVNGGIPQGPPGSRGYVIPNLQACHHPRPTVPPYTGLPSGSSFGYMEHNKNIVKRYFYKNPPLPAKRRVAGWGGNHIWKYSYLFSSLSLFHVFIRPTIVIPNPRIAERSPCEVSAQDLESRFVSTGWAGFRQSWIPDQAPSLRSTRRSSGMTAIGVSD